METKQIMKYLFLLFLILIQDVYSEIYSCDDYVEYTLDEGKKTAIITIPAPGEGETKLTVFVALAGIISNENFEIATLTLRKDMYETMYDAMKGVDIQYKFILPQSEDWPVISKININSKDICESPRDSTSYVLDWSLSFMYPVGVSHMSVVPDRKPNRNNRISTTTSLSSKKVESVPTESIKTQCPVTQSTIHPIVQWLTSTSSSISHLTVETNPSRAVSISETFKKSITEPNSDFVESLKYCGKRNENMQPTHLIIGGEEVIPGEFPWMVAIFYMDKRNYVYKCAGTLISDRHVLTAAHCVKNKNMIYMELGRHNITDNKESNYQTGYSKNVLLHPNYNENEGSDNDIAIVEIDPIKLTDRIKPICLCRFDSNIINSKSGIVTGWGRQYDDGTHSSVPMKIRVDKVDLDTCRKSNDILNDVVTQKHFCAGGQRKGPCHGDSGSGFYQHDNGVWFIRGIVSSSIGNSTICHVDKYAVYVDVLYFLDWIKMSILTT